MYKYTECGLDNIELVNGYEIENTPYGEGVRIKNIPGLHRAIGWHLVNKPEKLTGKEFRFLRVELGLSQRRTAEAFDTSEQNIGRWERGDVDQVPGPADRLMRALYAEYIDKDSRISNIVDRLCELDRELHNMQEIKFEDSPGGWREAA